MRHDVRHTRMSSSSSSLHKEGWLQAQPDGKTGAHRGISRALLCQRHGERPGVAVRPQLLHDLHALHRVQDLQCRLSAPVTQLQKLSRSIAWPA